MVVDLQKEDVFNFFSLDSKIQEYLILLSLLTGMVELVDALDLGSSII